MARVPTYDNFQAQPTNAPQVNIGQINAPVTTLLTDAPMMPAPRVMPDIVGKTMQVEGAEMLQSGRMATNLAIDMQKEINQTRVAEALTKSQQFANALQYDPKVGFLNVKGEQALNRPNGVSLSDEYTQKFNDHISDVAQGLGNEAQKRDYLMHAATLSTGLQRSAMAHQAQQIPDYQNSVAKGMIDTQQNTIALNPNDTQGNALRAQSIYENNRIIARNMGKSQEEADATSFKIVSGAHRVAVSGLIEANQYGQADKYAQDHKDAFTADDRNAVTRMVQNRQAAVASDAIAHDIVASNAPGTDSDRAHNILHQSEANNQQFRSDGQIVTSPKGAKGVSQIMDGTGPEAAKAAGIPWNPELFNRPMTGDKTKDQEAFDYNKRLGDALFDKYVQKYGSFDKAWAAYNAGEGKNTATGLDKDGNPLPGLQPAMARAAAKGTDWLSELSPETRAYVTKNVNAFNEGKGQNTPMTQKEAMDAAEAKFRVQHPDLANNPDLVNQARSTAGTLYQQNKADTLQREDQSISDAYNWGDKNGWNWSKMPDTMKTNIPTDKRLSLEHVFTQQGKVSTDLVALGYFKMKSPEELKSYTPESFIAEYHDKFSSDALHEGLNAISRAKSNDPESAAFLTTNQQVKFAAQTAGILPRGAEPSAKQAEDFQHFSESIDARIKGAEAQNGGKKLDADGIKKVINDVMIDRAYTDEWGRDPNKLLATMSPEQLQNAYVRIPVIQGGKNITQEIYLRDIPAAPQKQLMDELVKQKVPVTSENLVKAWLLQKGVQLGG